MILGITGGIGSGKSLVTDYLSEKYCFTAVKTDDLAREMMNNDPCLKQKLMQVFGKEIYMDDGRLDKTVYANIIHSDKENRLKSDRIVHPAVWTRVKELTVDGTSAGNRRNYAVETALPGEKLQRICSEVWYVHSDPEVRIERLMLNRGYARAYSESVIRGQISEEEYRKTATVVINNNTTVEELYRTVDRLIEERKVFS